MPKVGKKLKIVDVKTELEVPPESHKEVDADKQEIVEEVVAPAEPVVMKPKSRARPKHKASLEKVEEATEEVTEEVKEEEVKEEKVKEEEVKEEVKEEEVKEEVKEEAKERNLVQCPQCQKWLTPKGLKYSHKCPAAKTSPKVVERVIEKRVIERAPKVIKEKPDYSNIPEEIIEKEIERRRMSQKEQRSMKKVETMKRLTMNIA
jgi:hypothetical protein